MAGSSAIFVLAVVSAVMQAIGYIAYLRAYYRGEIEPEPTTWFMFAYGTIILTILEWDKGANPLLLLQPAICGIGGIWVAFRLLSKGKIKWPEEKIDRNAFLFDLILTVVYVASKVAQTHWKLTSEMLGILLTVYLVCSNLSGVVSFVPLIGNTAKHPRNERASPWFLWGLSYLLLGVTTYLQYGTWVSIFMLYPVLNMVLHPTVGFLSLLPSRDRPR
jgi:hypothetical protein